MPGTSPQLDVPGMFTKAELERRARRTTRSSIQAVGFNGVEVNTGRPDRARAQGRASPGVVLDANGKPTGQLTGTASQAASRSIGAELGQLTTEEQADCLEDFMREANRVGLTGWDDPGGNDPFDRTAPASRCSATSMATRPSTSCTARDG